MLKFLKNFVAEFFSSASRKPFDNALRVRWSCSGSHSQSFVHPSHKEYYELGVTQFLVEVEQKVAAPIAPGPAMTGVIINLTLRDAVVTPREIVVRLDDVKVTMTHQIAYPNLYVAKLHYRGVPKTIDGEFMIYLE